MGILSVRIGCSCPGHHNAGILCQRDNPLRTAIHGIEGNEISSLGLQPGTDLKTSQLPIQNLFHRLELGPHDCSMLFHMLPDSVQIFEKADMTELIQFVMTNGLNGHLLLNILQIIIGRGNRRNAGAREADL